MEHTNSTIEEQLLPDTSNAEERTSLAQSNVGTIHSLIDNNVLDAISSNPAIQVVRSKVLQEAFPLVPMKRKTVDYSSSFQQKASESTFEIPPKRRRKENRPCSSVPHLNLEKGTTEVTNANHCVHDPSRGDPNMNSSSTSSRHLSSPKLTGRTVYQSGFALQTPVTSGSLLAHLTSLLDECRATTERASRHQNQQEQYTRELEFKHREEIGRLRRKLDQVTSMLARECEAHAQLRDAFSEMTKKLEYERQACSDIASSLAKESAIVTDLRSELAEEQRKLKEERVNSQGLSVARADLSMALEKSKAEAKSIAAEVLAESMERQKKYSTDIEEQKARIQFVDAERQLLMKNLISERHITTLLKRHTAEAERKLVTFHFGANILTSYFLVMLQDNKTPRISSKRKARDDVHDLWDVQSSLKRLVDGCTSFLDKIPNRLDFYEDAGCPMCLPEASSSTADPVPFVQVSPRIKEEPVDIMLPRPLCLIPPSSHHRTP